MFHKTPGILTKWPTLEVFVSVILYPYGGKEIPLGAPLRVWWRMEASNVETTTLYCLYYLGQLFPKTLGPQVCCSRGGDWGSGVNWLLQWSQCHRHPGAFAHSWGVMLALGQFWEVCSWPWCSKLPQLGACFWFSAAGLPAHPQGQCKPPGKCKSPCMPLAPISEAP